MQPDEADATNKLRELPGKQCLFDGGRDCDWLGKLASEKRRIFVKDQRGDPTTCAPSKGNDPIGKSRVAKKRFYTSGFLAQVVRQDQLQETLYVFQLPGVNTRTPSFARPPTS